MKTRIIFSLFFILILILSSCGQGIAAPLMTQTSIALQPPTEVPTITPLPTVYLGLFTLTPVSTAIPYPTASIVKANAIAFIERVGIDYSLWVANEDGSGERKLVDVKHNENWVFSHVFQWSPNGKWISYLSNDELWIVSPDGSTNKKILSFPNLYRYVWSPDSSKIAYIQTATQGPVLQITVGILNVATGEVSEISSHEAPDPAPISWSPDGRYLLFARDFSYALYEVDTHEIAKGIKPNRMGCWVGWSIWSPNNEWFFDAQHGNGRYFRQWVCVSGLDGSNRKIHVEGTVSTPVWDKTGNFLYFVARKTNPDSDPNLEIDEWLMKYDVRTQKTEHLLSLRAVQTYGYIGQVSISPDGNTLVIQTQDSENQVSYILVDLKTFSLKKFTRETFCTWSADSESFICLQESNGYSVFHNLNIETGVTNIISGEHLIESWRVSPIATTP